MPAHADPAHGHARAGEVGPAVRLDPPFLPLQQLGRHRRQSFREFMDEWIVSQFLGSLAEYGLEKPWYWDIFVKSLDTYHHMVYASAYTYRATVWFNMVVPGPDERQWLQEKYPATWR